MTDHEAGGSGRAQKTCISHESGSQSRWRRELMQILDLAADKIFKRHDPGDAAYRLKKFVLTSEKSYKKILDAEAELAAELYVIACENLSEQILRVYISSPRSRRSIFDLATSAGIGDDLRNRNDAIGIENGSAKAEVWIRSLAQFLTENDLQSNTQAASGNKFQFDYVLSIADMWGTVKWFDRVKRRGIIGSDEGGDDIHFSISDVQYFKDIKFVDNGSRIHCQVMRQDGRLQVVRIWDLVRAQATSARRSLWDKAWRVKATSRWERAAVKWYNKARGFGFLTRGEHTPDIFVHIKTVRLFGFAELEPGQLVEVRWGQGLKGLTAAELRPTDASRLLPVRDGKVPSSH